MRGVGDDMGVGAAGGGADSRLAVRFYKKAVQDAAKSTEAGRPIFEEKDFVVIMVPGDKDNIVDRQVWDDASNPNSDTQRFGRQYDAWRRNQQQETTGTPLSAWPGVTRSQVEELAYLKVYSVEQLASVSDGNLQKMGPGYLGLRLKARDFLQAAAGTAPVEKMRAELEKRDSEMETLKRALREQGEALAQLQKAKK